jgi:DNA-binding SARP family transcriptional activator
VRRPDGTEIAIPRRRLALLLAVVGAGSRGISRDKLLGLLWPELDEERGRAALSQALYALRKDLGSEDAISGTADLRADPAQLSSDRGEFLHAIEGGEDAEGVHLYRGPYLDGFYVREAPEFDQLVEQERQQLRARYTAALERLAEGEAKRGDHAAAVRLWRQRANLDPTDSTVAVALMRALANAGDRAGALRHAEVYAELLKSSADLPPEGVVLALAEEIRRGGGGPTPPPQLRPPSSSGDAPLPASATPSVPGPSLRSWWRPWLRFAAAFGVIILLLRLLLPESWRARLFGQGRADRPRVVAVTEFQDFAGDSLTGPLTELLRSSLANVPGLGVISAERMADGAARDPGSSPLAVAQEAGATEALNGALFRRPGGTLRFDLRRVRTSDGRVLEALELEGKDVFELTTQATRRLLERYGVPHPGGDVTAVSSSSLTAIRLYQAGLDASFRGDGRAAYNLFVDATREDTAFAMAEFYAAHTAPNDDERTARFDRAHLLGLSASLRERLIIDVNRAGFHSTPGAVPLAESLVTLFPREPSGHLALGRALMYQEGDFLGAARAFRNGLRYDSVGFIAVGRRCDACVLYHNLFTAWTHADSFPAARRTIEEWTRNIPGDPSAWRSLASVALLTDDSVAWARGRARAAALEPGAETYGDDFYAAFYRGDLVRADSLMALLFATRTPDRHRELHWINAHLRREQGRPRAALAAMTEWRRLAGPRLPYEAVFQAQTLFDAGQVREALSLWERTGHLGAAVPSRAARGWSWAHTLMGTALVALGDTAKLRILADSMRTISQGSGFVRDRRLPHHLLGLYHAARGDDTRALAEFRQSVWSYTAGYTRTDLEIGRVLLRLGQPREAALVCGSGLRAEMSASAQYVSRGELHECAAQAWIAAGVPDSARAHLTVLVRQWQDPEPEWRARRDSAVALLRTLGSAR